MIRIEGTLVLMAHALIITVSILTFSGVCANNSWDYGKARKDAIHERNSGAVRSGRIKCQALVRSRVFSERAKSWARLDYSRSRPQWIREAKARSEAWREEVSYSQAEVKMFV